MLKIAAADKSWLQQLVLTERRRLASLHRSALCTMAPNTETSKNDHAEDEGYKAALAEKREAPKTGSVKNAFHPDDMGVENNDIETINAATEHLEDMHPEVSPDRIFDVLNNIMQPGLDINTLITQAEPMLRVASAKKADQSPNDPSGWAVESHEEAEREGEKNYETALDPKVGSKRKQAAELKVDDSGTPPNTSRATEDHDFELKALAAQIQGKLGGKPSWDPNDPLLD